MKNNSKYPYREVEETPLKFYKFVIITLIIGLFSRGAMLLSLFARYTPDFEHWYNIGFSFACLVLNVFALMGLNSMKWYGVLCYMGRFGLIGLDALVSGAIIIFFGETELDLSTCIARIIAAVIWLIPLWIYFRHRRLLFSPPPADDPRSPQSTSPMMDFAVPAPRPVAAEAPVVQATPLAPEPVVSSMQATAPPSSDEGLPKASKSSSSGYYFSELTAIVGAGRATASPPSKEPTPKQHPPVLFCRKCGNRLLPDSAFCSYCGTNTEV